MEFSRDLYPILAEYTEVLKPLNFRVEGRDRDINRIQATFKRDVVTNVFLLGNAGVGKTTLIRHMISEGDDFIYLEVDLIKMTSSDKGDGIALLAPRLKALLGEVERYADLMRDKPDAKKIALFIDEVHLLFDVSGAGAQAIKPALADSAARGIYFIAATTLDEYFQYKIDQDQAFTQRFVMVQLEEPNDDQVVEILKTRAKHSLGDDFEDDVLLRQIVEMTNRYDIAASQPRKSIMLFDAMVGSHRHLKKEFDKSLLAEELYNTKGVNIAINVDATTLKREMDAKVFDQGLATYTLESYLQIVVANLNNPDKPLGSFLFTGPTGVGKTELSKRLAELMFGKESYMVRFNMSEYSNKDRVTAFREKLAREVTKKPYCVLLLDEVEKADRDCILLLLQVLDDAELSDSNERNVSFKNCLIILTTNEAAGVYKDRQAYRSKDDEDDALEEFLPLVRADLIESGKFPAELVGRVDKIVIFGGLLDSAKLKIASSKLEGLRKRVAETHGVRLQFGPELIYWLVYQKNESDTDAGGARGFVRAINEELTSVIARYLNKHNDVKELFVVVDPDTRVSKINQKLDLQFTTKETRMDYSSLYVGEATVAKALSMKNMAAIKGWLQRIQ